MIDAFIARVRNALTKAKIDADALASARAEIDRLRAKLSASERALAECRTMVANLAASLDTGRTK